MFIVILMCYFSQSKRQVGTFIISFCVCHGQKKTKKPNFIVEGVLK